jgi:hypothetical protein
MHIEAVYHEGRSTCGGNPSVTLWCRDCRRTHLDFYLLTWFHQFRVLAGTNDFGADLERFIKLVNARDFSVFPKERSRRKLRECLCGCDDFGRTEADLQRDPTREELQAQSFADRMHAIHPEVFVDQLVHREGAAWAAKFYTPAGGYLWTATLRQIEDRIRADVREVVEAEARDRPPLRLL